MSPLAALCRRSVSILSTDYPAGAGALGAYRIAYATVALLLVGVPRVSWIAGVPAAFFDPPPGLARLMPGFPADWVLHVVDLAVVLLYLALLIGWRTRVVSVAITVLLVYGHLFEFSFGKIDHDAIAIATPALFAWSWGRSFSLDARRGRERAADDGLSRGLLASLLAFGFFTAGFPKLLAWLDFDLSTHGVLSWVLNTERSDRNEFLVPFFRRLENPWVWESLDIGAIVFEMAAIVALFLGARAFKGWCVAAVLFHFFNYLMLNIGFTSFLPLYMAFIDWQPVADRARRAAAGGARTFATGARLTFLVAAATLIVLAMPYDGAGRWSLASSVKRIVPLGGWTTFLLLAASAAIALTLATRALLRETVASRDVPAKRA